LVLNQHPTFIVSQRLNIPSSMILRNHILYPTFIVSHKGAHYPERWSCTSLEQESNMLFAVDISWSWSEHS